MTSSIPLNPTLPISAFNELHTLFPLTSLLVTRAKFVLLKENPNSLSSPPFIPAKALTSIPEIVRVSTVASFPSERFTICVSFSNPNLPSTLKKSYTLSLTSPETPKVSPDISKVFVPAVILFVLFL